VRDLINLFWYLFRWGSAIAVVALVAAALARFMHMDNEIRARVEAKLAAGYPQFKVTVREARLVEGQGIEVRGVSIADPHAVGPTAELVYIDEMLLTCGTDIADLARGEPSFSQVALRRARIRATRRLDGKWSTSGLLPLPKLGSATPPTEINGATIELYDPTRTPASVFAVRNVELSLKPDPQVNGKQTLEGSLTADGINHATFSGSIFAATNQLELTGAAETIAIAPELLAKLPSDIPQPPAPLHTLRADARLGFRVQYQPRAASPLTFVIDGAIINGQVTDPRWPYPITDVRAQWHATNAGFTINEVSAHCATSAVTGSIVGIGYGPSSQMTVDLDAKHVRLEQKFAASLPEPLQQSWYKFLPEGDVDGHARLVCEAGRWTPDITVNCRNVSFSYYKFPYRLDNAKGVLHRNGNTLDLRMTAMARSQPIHITGKYQNPGPQFTGWTEVDGDDIPIDDKLMTALPDKCREVVRSLRPQGSVNVFARIGRDDPNANPSKQMLLAFNRCVVNYTKFPYPLTDIRGKVQLLNDEWTFHDLVGMNDTGLITCRGSLGPVEQGTALDLHFTGERIPLEEELRLALPPNVQRLWRSLEPRGEVNLSTDVTYLSAQRKMSVTLVAEPRGTTTSIEPQAFPYRMEKLRGTLRYRDGHAELEKIEAEHGRTTLATDCQCDFLSDGSWSLQLKNFAVDRLQAEHDLMSALPGALKRGVSQLRPVGPINLRGNVVFSRPGEPDAPLDTRWDCVADLLQTNLDCGIKLANLFGSVRLMGSSRGERFTSRGEFSLDSLTYNDFQFTEVTGPMWIDNERVLFGGWTPSAGAAAPPRRLAGKLCKGTIAGDAQVVFANAPRYALQASLSEADLQQVVSEHLSSKQRVQGRLMANVELQGVGRGTHTMMGKGNLRLHDADIYQLPLMVSMLKILSIKPPNATAFTKSDIDFRIQGEHLLFDRINFNGDAVSLLGKGQMSFDRQLDLTFHAMVGRDDSNFQVPILRSVIGEASQQIMQIRVEGSCEDPITRSEAFPGVNQALQALQAEFQGQSQQPPVNREAILPKR
jgi:hypothetical protein